MAPVTVGHRGKGDRSNGGGQIYLDHPAIDDQHDADGKGIHGQAHKKGLEPQPEQFPGPQGFKLRLQIRDDTVHINALNNMDRDLLLVAKDDELARKLQDLGLPVRKRAPKRRW